MANGKMLAGTFAFRFSGYTMAQDRPWFLTGLGHFQIDALGKVTGQHRSAITPIQGQNAALTTTVYTLDGTISIRSDGTGEAKILFTSEPLPDDTVRILDGEFYVLLAGNADRLWMISSSAKVNDAPVDELVNLEAVRVTS
jgi:hypothetical protein